MLYLARSTVFLFFFLINLKKKTKPNDWLSKTDRENSTRYFLCLLHFTDVWFLPDAKVIQKKEICLYTKGLLMIK